MADDPPGTGGLHVEPVGPDHVGEAALWLTDARSGRPTMTEPGYRRALRVRVHLARPGDAIHLPDLRALLIADVLARTAELYGGQALIGVTGEHGEHGDALLRHAARLGIRPPSTPGPGERVRRADVHLIAPAAARPDEDADADADAADAVLIDIAPVHPHHAQGIADALALRLALLARVHDQPLALTPHTLAQAQHCLAHWRRTVAAWSRAPSRPMCADILGHALTALTHNLTVPAVLDALHHLEKDPAVPDGSRFETAAHLDRVLGLDLTRDVGR